MFADCAEARRIDSDPAIFLQMSRLFIIIATEPNTSLNDADHVGLIILWELRWTSSDNT